MLPGRRDGVGRLFVKGTPPPPFNSAFMGGIALSPLGQVQIANAPANAYDAVTLDGVAGTYISTPDSVANSITGDIDIRAKVSMVDWTPASPSRILAKRGGNTSYDFYVETTGVLGLYCGVYGATSGVTSIGFTDGSVGYVRATRSASTGEFKFYKSDDGVNWVQLGPTNAQSPGLLTVTVEQVAIGALSTGASSLAGKIYEIQIRNGINGPVAVSFNAADAKFNPGGYLEGLPRDATGKLVTLPNGTPVPIPGAVMGPELVSNGDFSNGTTGWTSSSSVLSVIGGQLEVSSLGDGAAALQEVPVVSGKTYKFSTRVLVPSSNIIANAGRIYSTPPAANLVATVEDVQQTLAYNFIASSSPVTLLLQVANAAAWGAVGDKTYFDAISLREVDPNAYNMLGGLSIANTGLYTTDVTPA